MIAHIVPGSPGGAHGGSPGPLHANGGGSACAGAPISSAKAQVVTAIAMKAKILGRVVITRFIAPSSHFVPIAFAVVAHNPRSGVAHDGSCDDATRATIASAVCGLTPPH
jgi:hypothetical protein